MASKFVAYAKIKSENGEWTEDFTVTSKESAEAEVKDVVEFFNTTLKRGESPREFVSLERVETKYVPDPEDEDDDDYDDDDRWDDYDEEDAYLRERY
jgi:hypothetical protein